MLSSLRHLFIDSWVGRILVGLIFIVFAGWGLENIWTSQSQKNANVVAWIGNQTISVQQLNTAVKGQLGEYAAEQGFADISQIPNNTKTKIVNQALQQLMTQTSFIEAAHNLGLTVPDDILRHAVFAMPQFQKNGQFDRAIFDNFLQQSHITQDAFLNIVRDQYSFDAIIRPLTAGTTVPNAMIKPFFDYQNETRTIAYKKFPLDSFKPEPPPSEAVLKRYYDNHMWEFTAPEFRRVKLIFISPETVAKDVVISDQDILNYYNTRKDLFKKPATKAIQLITVKNKEIAENLAKAWKNTSWDEIQKQTAKEHGFVSNIPDFSAASSPSLQLTNAVNKVNVNDISSPVQTPMGWSVFKVIALNPAHDIPLSDVKQTLKQELTQAKAKQTFGNNIKEIQDVLAGGAGLDGKLGGLGVVAVEGTLNEQGLTTEGMPAPIPSDPKTKQAMLTNIFSAAKNGQPSLIQGDNNIYYAFVVENIDPSHQEKFEDVKEKVLKTWQKATIQKQANIAASALFKEVQSNKSAIKGENATFSRNHLIENIPASLQNASFQLQNGQSTMVETPDAFYVATLTHISAPTIQTDSAAYKNLKNKLIELENNDILLSYKNFVQSTQKSSSNQQAIDAVIKQYSN
ncbi:peptidylprolyl isomerase [Commensalibacter oyaizuii]|uniref:Parvulin-like PPIase n=1 Tax=Commensalibacter oyaizuii TaxID=3043873 RepID=A0ABT6PZF9_9PROT|nr:peptidylprolyl isomerase [Commensalibacter sp. TBRC 16381]MDI2090241.1 peptidyl-prolyl cis-trans isomerase [Commensalibacter sp. TBRC 16381]